MRRRAPASRLRAGFTLVETAIALWIFAVVGYSLAVGVTLGEDAHRAIQQVVSENRSVRRSVDALVQDLKESSDARITVTALADGNSQVTLQLPIDVDGAMAWGVHETALATDAAAQVQQDWSVRYLVRSELSEDGGQVRRLVRQILDTQAGVRHEDVLLSGLRNGTGATPGFRVARVGAVWEIALATTGASANEAGIEIELHAQTRN